jgi:hypothetical protein
MVEKTMTLTEIKQFHWEETTPYVSSAESPLAEATKAYFQKVRKLDRKFGTKLPLVTAVTPTRNRRQWLPQAIQCFQRQTYPNREMLIVYDSEDDIRGLAPKDRRIRALKSPGFATLGEKRNFCCEQARGEFIAHFDDDDYQDCDRLEWQARLLLANPDAAITMFVSTKVLDVRTGRWWWIDQKKNAEYVWCSGCSFFYRRDWWEKNRFPAMQTGEDSELANISARAGKILVDSMTPKMYVRDHGKNTFEKNTALGAGLWALSQLGKNSVAMLASK